MGHGMGYVYEEWLVFVGLDEVDRLLGTAPGDGALINRNLDDLFILEQGGLPLGKSGFGVVPQDIHAGPTALRFTLVVGMVHIV